MAGLDEELSFEEMMALSDEEIGKLLFEYEEFKKERAKFMHEAFIKLPHYPPLVLDSIHYLKVQKGVTREGIFRVNGDAKAVDVIRTAYSNAVDTDDILSSVETSEKLNCYDVATALKSYFRLLDQPLIPYDVYEEMKDAVEGQTDRDLQINALKTQIGKIAEPNLSILAYFMKFLQEIIAEKETNKMTANNMATCLTMSITRFIAEEGKANTHFLAMIEVGLSTKIIALLLTDVNFDDYISPEKVFDLLKHTNYRTDLIPETLEEFLDSPYNSRRVQEEQKKVPPKVPPRVPPRNGRSKPQIQQDSFEV